MIASRTLARFIACAFLHPAMKMSKHDAGLRSKKVVLWNDRVWINAVRGRYGDYGKERGFVYAREMMCCMEVGLVAGI
jgi:hypothetical protein